MTYLAITLRAFLGSFFEVWMAAPIVAGLLIPRGLLMRVSMAIPIAAPIALIVQGIKWKMLAGGCILMTWPMLLVAYLANVLVLSVVIWLRLWKSPRNTLSRNSNR